MSATTTMSAVDFQAIFNKQKENQYAVGATTARERVQKIKKILHAVEVEYRQAIRDALMKDMGKSQGEADLTEIYPVTGEAKHAISHLSRWMNPQSVDTPLAMLGSSSWIKYEPKGVCLLISPWNFPFNLTLCPLISAIAAGNTVIVKPSEMTPHSSALMREMLENLFPENEIALVEGGVDVSTALLELPFNHIFFTGAPSIGKVVMAAAAKNLTSVTLELGGKSPTIVDETANIGSAAKRIAWGKFVNSGQVCIAPDYVFVHESKKEAFVDALKEQITSFYGQDVQKSNDLTKVVNQRHFDRVKGYIDDAVLKGARVVMGGQSNRDSNYVAPTILENAPLDSAVMVNEIFGPVLPIYTFKDINEPLNYIRANEKPLALYIYSNSSKNIKNIVDNTRAGGTCINNNAVHFFNNNLPFGGANNSGLGNSHGKFGFEAFSHARGILKQHIPGALELLMPPYTGLKEKLINLTIKWF